MKKVISLLLSICMLLSVTAGMNFNASAVTSNSVQANSLASGDIIQMGMYPQTRVTSDNMLNKLESINCTLRNFGYMCDSDAESHTNTTLDISYADISCDGLLYRKVVMNSCRPIYTSSSQDGSNYHERNGYSPKNTYYFKWEPMEWRVLGKSNDGVYVMSEKLIDSQAYHYYDEDSTWENCSLRNWLNNEFYNLVFSKSEKSSIKYTYLNNENNPYNSTNGGNATNDYIWIPSYSDMINTNYGFSADAGDYDSNRLGKGTDYAKMQGLYVNSSGYSWWWLRTPGKSSNSLMGVYDEGYIYNYSSYFSFNATDEGIRPAFIIKSNASVVKSNKDSYSSKYGWSLTNKNDSYGYTEHYKIKPEKYYSLFGISLSTLLLSSVKMVNEWGGSCFGLSLLSLAQYYNIVDLKPLFSGDSEYLYDFGYERIYENPDGEQCFSVEGNNKAIDLIERAMISQNSVEFSESEILKYDSDYSELLEFLNSADARPILVTFNYGKFGHAMVVTTDFKPVKLNNSDYYKIPVYDSNAPENSDKLTNPMSEYTRGPSYLLVNPITGKWQYYAEGKVQKQASYYSISEWKVDNALARSIRFFDVSSLDKSFFTKTLNAFYKHIQLQFSSNNISIQNDSGELLLKITDGNITDLAKDCICNSNISSENDESAPVFTFYTDTENLTIASDNAEILGVSSDCALMASSEKANTTKFNFAQGTVTVSSKENNESIIIASQDLKSNNCIKATAKLNNNEYATINTNDNTKKSLIKSNSDNVNYVCEGVADNNVIKDINKDEQLKTNLSKVQILGIKNKTYTGNTIKQSVTVKFGNKTLKYGTDYSVLYKDNKKIGKSTVVITGKGNYYGTVEKSFKILPKGTSISKATSPKSKQIKVFWKKQKKQTTGYQIQYSADKSFKKGNKTVNVSKNKTTSKTISKLKGNKIYYVRIRTYKKVGKTNYYSFWSKAKSVKTKK